MENRERRMEDDGGSGWACMPRIRCRGNNKATGTDPRCKSLKWLESFEESRHRVVSVAATACVCACVFSTRWLDALR
jgi:hypothetical protein